MMHFIPGRGQMTSHDNLRLYNSFNRKVLEHLNDKISENTVSIQNKDDRCVQRQLNIVFTFSCNIIASSISINVN